MGKRTRKMQRAFDMRKQPNEPKDAWRRRRHAAIQAMQAELLETVHRIVEK